MTVIQVSNLKHQYGNREALKGIDLNINENEIFGMLGPNGSGKTTLFRILSTVFPPTSGQITFAGFDLLKDDDKVRSKIGVVFQSPSLDKQLSVYENLYHYGLFYGLSGAALHKRCDEMLERLGLTDRKKEKVIRLSGGLMRRVELAKGLLHKPDFLFLDEPSTGLDPGARMDLWRYLKELQSTSKVTILVTTHLMEEAEECHRLAIMNEGRLVCVGTPNELKEKIGGDILEIKSENIESLALQIKEKFKIESTRIDDTLILEHAKASQFVTTLIEAFPGQLKAVTFRKPTLGDVFSHHTGHTFWREKETEISKKVKK